MPKNSIWVDLTTNDKDVLLEVSKLAFDKGINVVEAPVTGAVDGARLRKLTFFIGGNTKDVEAVKPYFELLGLPIHCGELGSGNVLWHAIKNSVGDTFVARHDVPSIFAGHYDPSFSLELCCKDLRLLDQLGTESQTQIDVTAELLVCKRVENASNTNLKVEGDWIKHWEV